MYSQNYTHYPLPNDCAVFALERSSSYQHFVGENAYASYIYWYVVELALEYFLASVVEGAAICSACAFDQCGPA